MGGGFFLLYPFGGDPGHSRSCGSRDGRYRIPESLQVCDKDLAEKLIKISKSEIRSIKELKKENITVNASEYGGFEKVGDLGFSLPTSDENIGTNPGDIVLYQGDKISLKHRYDLAF